MTSQRETLRVAWHRFHLQKRADLPEGYKLEPRIRSPRKLELAEVEQRLKARRGDSQ